VDSDETERWRVWQNHDGFCAWGLHYIRLLEAEPPVVLRARTEKGVRARAAKFDEVFAETHSVAEALAAAENIEEEQ
jgi:hypothetical protein